MWKGKRKGSRGRPGGGKESDNYTRQELGKGKGKAARVQWHGSQGSENELINTSKSTEGLPITTEKRLMDLQIKSLLEWNYLQELFWKVTRVILLVPVITERGLLECRWSTKDAKHLAMPRTVLHSKELSCILCDLAIPHLFHVDEKKLFMFTWA